MRWLTSVAVVLLVTVGMAEAEQPVFQVVEQPEVTIVEINRKASAIKVRNADGSTTQYIVGKRTWIIADEKETTFSALMAGQRVRVHSIPRTWQTVSVEVLPPKKQPGR
jgi:hypothetical protein